MRWIQPEQWEQYAANLAAGLPKCEAARRAGLSYQTVWRAERGEKTSADIWRTWRAAQARNEAS